MGPARILVVDDEPYITDLLAAALRFEGFEVEVAATGAEALRRIDLEAVRAEGYGFQIEMVYQVIQHGVPVTEVPIRFVDRVEGKSKMSAYIVVEALALVTWWGVLRLVGAMRQRRHARLSAPAHH